MKEERGAPLSGNRIANERRSYVGSCPVTFASSQDALDVIGTEGTSSSSSGLSSFGTAVVLQCGMPGLNYAHGIEPFPSINRGAIMREGEVPYRSILKRRIDELPAVHTASDPLVLTTSYDMVLEAISLAGICEGFKIGGVVKLPPNIPLYFNRESLLNFLSQLQFPDNGDASEVKEEICRRLFNVNLNNSHQALVDAKTMPAKALNEIVKEDALKDIDLRSRLKMKVANWLTGQRNQQYEKIAKVVFDKHLCDIKSVIDENSNEIQLNGSTGMLKPPEPSADSQESSEVTTVPSFTLRHIASMLHLTKPKIFTWGQKRYLKNLSSKMNVVAQRSFEWFKSLNKTDRLIHHTLPEVDIDIPGQLSLLETTLLYRMPKGFPIKWLTKSSKSVKPITASSHLGRAMINAGSMASRAESKFPRKSHQPISASDTVTKFTLGENDEKVDMNVETTVKEFIGHSIGKSLSGILTKVGNALMYVSELETANEVMNMSKLQRVFSPSTWLWSSKSTADRLASFKSECDGFLMNNDSKPKCGELVTKSEEGNDDETGELVTKSEEGNDDETGELVTKSEEGNDDETEHSTYTLASREYLT